MGNGKSLGLSPLSNVFVLLLQDEEAAKAPVNRRHSITFFALYKTAKITSSNAQGYFDKYAIIPKPLCHISQCFPISRRK